jgi:4-hydroxy-tetrahydrodipicolinate synthase
VSGDRAINGGMIDDPLAGVFAPALTPFDANLKPDEESLVRFCRWLLSQDVGLAVFGTNSEANSLSVSERIDLLDALIEAGLPPKRMMPGTGACALSDAVRLCGAAAKAGTAAVLMLPPFYYKPVSDEGLFAFYAETIERVGDARLKICLYHIPQISGVPITLELIAKLTGRYPETAVGIKDSGGKFENTKAMLESFPGFRVFCGSERFLTDTARHGGAGCISALANVNTAAISEAWRRREEPCAEARQRALSAIRDIFEAHAVIPALKETVARFGGCESFRIVRPPLLPLSPGQSRALTDRLLSAGFEMPELRQALAR